MIPDDLVTSSVDIAADETHAPGIERARLVELIVEAIRRGELRLVAGDVVVEASGSP